MSTEPTATSRTVPERMFGHKGQPMRVLAITTSIVACALLAGCGTDEAGTSADAVEEADQADVEVIESWSSALAEGDVDAAAAFFAIPSIAQNGPFVTKIDSREAAVAFNESLPCGAEVISARSQGEFTTATFELSERPGPGLCGAGTGGIASTSFVIEDGKIVEWRRVDGQPPGGEGGGDAPV